MKKTTWTSTEEAALILAIEHGIPTKRIAATLDRSEDAVDSRAWLLREQGRLEAKSRWPAKRAAARNDRTRAGMLEPLRLIADLLPEGTRVVLTRPHDGLPGIDIASI